ncbi:unnamed protein product [Chrysodeixis includens]|uniref:Mitochondrial ribonuclease P catalytic subunit n=1 Tax=Chrysodeixis includens TaxID=689277 RepID=A0A9P0C536_CHRIL|nr:unnamed protein product [Chrysodeixis includens]
MFFSLTRTFSSRSSYATLATRLYNQKVSYAREKQPDEQIEYIKAIEKSTQNWTIVKSDILSKRGNVNQKNIDSVLLKSMTTAKNFDAALSFTKHLQTTSEELSLGTINSILGLYAELEKTTNTLSKDQKQFILDSYKHLYDKYKMLDYTTCEKLLHALCAIKEWEKALKVLNDIHISTVPSHSAYSTLIATFFKLNKKKNAFQLIEESVQHKRPLQENAYEEWMNYILRKFKDKKVIAKHVDDLFSHVAKNCAIIPKETANKLKELYSAMNWDAQFSRIKKVDGQCSCCKEKLENLSLTNEEFNTLQGNVKEKLIMGSDLFLKTSPQELKRFLDFIEKTAPYDVVLDGLNIAYSVGMAPHREKLSFLINIVDHFLKQKKKVLLLGRKHMLGWHKRSLDQIMGKTCSFFTEDISQDDPYFITAAILSGPHTDIVSKDLLRGHTFLLQNESLRLVFKRWQWQHQWMVFLNVHKGFVVQPPLKFTPCPQKKDNTWHLPYDNQVISSTAQVNDGTPDLYSWMCLRRK